MPSPDPAAYPTVALVVADLLEPEASGRAVEQPEQSQVIVLARSRRQLDYGR